MSAVMQRLRDIRSHLPAWAYVEREREVGRGFHMGPIVVVSRKSIAEKSDMTFLLGMEAGSAPYRPHQDPVPEARHLRSV